MCTKSVRITPKLYRRAERRHRGRVGVAEQRQSTKIGELRKSAGVAELRNCKQEQLSTGSPLESPIAQELRIGVAELRDSCS